MKVWNYIFISTFLALILEFSGIQTGYNGVLNLVGLGADTITVTNSSFYNAIFVTGILVTLIAGVSIGVLTKSNPENWVILPLITGTLIVFVQTFYSVMQYTLNSNIEPWVRYVVLLVLGPFTVGYILACVEFFRGTD